MNNIYSKIDKAVEFFDTQTVNVIGDTDKGTGVYAFSQKQLLVDIDMAINSIYKGGNYDKQGHRKLYLNKVRFYLSVANKNTDIDTGNLVLSPADYGDSNVWSVWFLNRQFRRWIKDEGFASIINEAINDFNQYGSFVLKQVGRDINRVPLRNLKNDQTSKTLMLGIQGGTPLIEEHNYSYMQMAEYKDTWTIGDYFEGKRKIYESYLYVSRKDYLETKKSLDEEYSEVNYSDDKSYDNDMIMVMCIYQPESMDSKYKCGKKVLFIEEVKEIPYTECHDDKQDNRWIGRGEVEKQLENQLASNLSVNLRLKSMKKASVDIYQTQGDSVAKNLITTVDDGEVLQVGLGGTISRIDNTSRAQADYTGNDQVWDDNSQKQAFSFESATGEGFSSGTPFRLGAMLSNSVMGYFDLKKEKIGLSLIDMFFSKLLTVFQKSAKDDLVAISQSEAGFNNIKNLFIEMYTGQNYADLALNPKYFEMESVPTKEQIQQIVELQLSKSPYLFIDVPKEIYKYAKANINFEITGEGVSPGDSESLTTLYTAMVQSGDPRATQLLDVILASKGKNLAAIAGSSMPASPNMSQTAQNPDLQGLISK